jgi:hypothetical protein
MKLKLEIDCSNSAFGESGLDLTNEIEAVFSRLNERLNRHAMPDMDGLEFTLRDSNGNAVGLAWFTKA